MSDLQKMVEQQLPNAVKNSSFSIGKRYEGKVRDVYDLGDKLLLVTTDRISAFDRVLSVIPFKGEVLNDLSLFWFEETSDILPNHIIKKIHPNAVLVKKCEIVQIEVIVRGYLTGGGWREYSKTGSVSGIKLPEGLKKDCKFETPILTPTTKAKEGHDMPISRGEIISSKIVPETLWNTIEEKAMALFARGQKIAAGNNLILVDTKYEFGQLPDGTLIIADEIHTSDSSRYWFADSYQELFEAGKEQRMFDKEYFRRWLMDQGYQGEGEAPRVPIEVITGVIERYIGAYETITGKKFPAKPHNAAGDLEKAVSDLAAELG
jgi:phosphoribosylaminoimidazole-succinocarboxamide synthase